MDLSLEDLEDNKTVQGTDVEQETEEDNGERHR